MRQFETLCDTVAMTFFSHSGDSVHFAAEDVWSSCQAGGRRAIQSGIQWDMKCSTVVGERRAAMAPADNCYFLSRRAVYSSSFPANRSISRLMSSAGSICSASASFRSTVIVGVRNPRSIKLG
jgi:hypothetical protein